MQSGITKAKIKYMSKLKNEPSWMLKKRLEAYEKFKFIDNPSYCKPFEINYKKLNYYTKFDIKNSLEKFKACQVNSSCYCNNQLNDIIFCDMETALQKYPELIKKYFNKVVEIDNNKYSALNYMLWSGGIFIYIPKNVKLNDSICYNVESKEEYLAQLDHSIIVVDENSEVNIIEKVTGSSFLRSSVVEIILEKNAKCVYKTIQKRYFESYNFETKKSIVNENAKMEWLDYNLGSKLNIKYPTCILNGNNASGSIVSLAVSNEGQINDIGTKMIHNCDNTKSSITSKLISNKGEANYRQKVHIKKNANNCKSEIKCETLLFDDSKGDIISNNTCNKTSTIISDINVLTENEFDDYKKELIIDLLKSQIEN